MSRIRVAFYRLVAVLSVAWWAPVIYIQATTPSMSFGFIAWCGVFYAFALGLAWAVSALLPK